MRKLLTAEEVADRLGIKVSTVYQWTYEEYIPHKKLGRLVRFDPDEIDQWVQKCTKRGRTTRSIDLRELGI